MTNATAPRPAPTETRGDARVETRVETRVRIAELAVGRGAGVLATVGLGSCVAVALYDRATGVGGLAHVLLPHPADARDRTNDAKFASTAVPRLLHEMRTLGATHGVEARLVGGATMFAALAGPGAQLGDRNAAAARAALAAAGVPVVAEAVGGESGRSAYLHLDGGRLVVRTLSGGDAVL